MSDLQSQNFIRISATTITPPSVRRHEQEVAKLIDVTRCIGCKACQAACMEWNDLRGEVGHFEGTYDNPLDLDPNTWTLMRFTEWDNDQGNLEWLIRKDGCMHCEDPGCLKACPAPGAIVQYANGIVDFISENCIGCGYCIKGCPFNIPRVSKIDHKSYKCTLCSDRVTVGREPACVKACPTGAIMFGSKTDMTNWAGERVIDLKSGVGCLLKAEHGAVEVGGDLDVVHDDVDVGDGLNISSRGEVGHCSSPKRSSPNQDSQAQD